MISTDTISLTAEVNFPNIEFSKADVDFGTILNATESAITISMKNKSPLSVEYQWWFELDSDSTGISVTSETNPRKRKALKSGAPDISKNSETEDEIELCSVSPIMRDEITIDKVFDILPLFGRIEPGQEIATTIVFVGHSNLTAQCRAVCDVLGKA